MEEGTTSLVKANNNDRANLAAGFAVPMVMSATENDQWLSDLYTGIMLRVVKDCEVLVEPVPVATDLYFPEDLAVDLDGKSLVAETGNESWYRDNY